MPTYGIDLGTTYSCVAYMDASGRPVIAQNLIGEDTTPSVVYFENADNVVVGVEAKKSALLDGDKVVSLIKRQMGKDFELEIDGVKHTPQSISGIILRQLAKATSDLTHEEVKDVVITVPAYFGVAERQATLDAGGIAGLNVLSLVPEPVAAALHYEAIAAEGGSTILVYDLGGGTFDTTVIRIDGDEINVVCTDGDHKLGGADWDTRVADYLLEAFMAENQDSAAAESEDFLQDLALAAENLKKGLSSAQSRRHNMRFDGAVARVELTREKFEELTADLLERTFKITERTLEVAREQGVTRFDEVLLVGGSSRMPAVEAGLRSQRFGFSPKLHDPDLAVAKGAARFALIESVKIRLPGGIESGSDDAAIAEVADQLGLQPDEVRRLAGKRITSVVPRAFGIKVLESEGADGPVFQVAHVLKANSPLPATPPAERFFTAYPDQTSVVVEIWEQAGATESPRLSDNNRIGEGEITGLPPLPQSSPLDISFAMDELGTLRVHAVEQRTGKELVIELRIDGLTAEEVVEARNAVARYDLTQ